MKMQKIFVAAIFILSIASCKKTDTTDASIAVSKSILNVAYGTDAAQVMDVYLPANRDVSTTKVMVMIHGGGWTGGDKADFNRYVDTIKRRMPNYAIININYRLAGVGTNLFPTQENDVKAAIDFIYSQSAAYAISNKFVLLGASAGGHLALLEGYKDSIPVKVKAVIDFFGPADMTEMYNNPTVSPGGEVPIYNVMGTTPTLDSLLYANSSPINFVKSTSPPTLIFHGGADPLVRPAQSDSLFARLDAANVIAAIVKYPTEGHGWEGANLYDSFNQVQAFLVAHVQ